MDDFSRVKQDIDELIDGFSRGESASFSEMKRVWASRKFAYIHEAAPAPTPYSFSNLAFFMQSLFARCLGHIVGPASLPRRLGGLYCLYCLHETQPYSPPFRIYLSLTELESIKDLVVAAKDRGAASAARPLVRRMIGKGMFMYGAVDAKLAASFTEKVKHVTELQDARVGLTYQKLIANTRIDEFLHADLAWELGLDVIKKTASEYAEAKKLAVGEARGLVDVCDIEHIAEDRSKPVGDAVEELVDEWGAKRKAFYQQTGLKS